MLRLCLFCQEFKMSGAKPPWKSGNSPAMHCMHGMWTFQPLYNPSCDAYMFRCVMQRAETCEFFRSVGDKPELPKLTDEAKKAYIKKKGVRCPYCGGDDLEGHQMHYFHTGDPYVNVTCHSCSREWTELLDIVGIKESDE